MSFYRFTIRDYHSVEEADIRIDGITVLAGVNSSGKSTTVADAIECVVDRISREKEYIALQLDDFRSQRNLLSVDD